VSQAHLYVLNNTAEVIPYIDAHKKELTTMNLKLNMMRVFQEHNRSFINWFRERIFLDDGAYKTLKLLAVGPNLNVPTWKGMISIIIPSTPSLKMTKAQCRIVE